VTLGQSSAFSHAGKVTLGWNRINILDLTIEKMIYGGAGIGRLPAGDKGRGKAAFVSFTVPGEKVRASVEETKPGFVRATAEEIVEPSARRIEPSST